MNYSKHQDAKTKLKLFNLLLIYEPMSYTFENFSNNFSFRIQCLVKKLFKFQNLRASFITLENF